MNVAKTHRDPDALLALVHVVKEKLAKIPPINASDAATQLCWEARYAAQRAAVNALLEELTRNHGAKVNARWDGTRIALAGVRASSTMGHHAALNNWVAAAYRRLDAGWGER